MEITKEIQKLMLERMWTIRNFEEKVIEVHEAGEFVGPAHPPACNVVITVSTADIPVFS